MHWLPHLTFYAGLASIVAGFAVLHPSLGLLAAGGLAVGLALLSGWARRRANRKS